ncbi:MAG: hypothetical protein DRR06_15195 [Gammaproteobacteria bacterium]|nr:MAG: hypothetical protein DRR06_15195 [Gammaproteobacteria bacterium]
MGYEKQTHDQVCDFITSRIRKNLRVINRMGNVKSVTIDKDVKNILLRVVKMVPDTLVLTERK